jgi:orotidine-5'-phosphate decarboxylase
MQNIKDKLIVALDVDTLKEAERIVKTLVPSGFKLFKIGSQLFTAFGPEAVKMVGKRGGKVFLDLKFHDIPNTVQNSCYSSTSAGYVAVPSTYSFIKAWLNLGQKVRESVQYPVFMLTVHTTAGIEALRSAVVGAEERAKELNISRPIIVGVTVLTSENLGERTESSVLERANCAKQAGLDGIVCSVHEAAAVREAYGKDFIIVTPGIRPPGSAVGDQKRVATAQAALAAGADYIVVGRPIIQAPDPLKAARDILVQMG